MLCVHIICAVCIFNVCCVYIYIMCAVCAYNISCVCIKCVLCVYVMCAMCEYVLCVYLCVLGTYTLHAYKCVLHVYLMCVVCVVLCAMHKHVFFPKRLVSLLFNFIEGFRLAVTQALQPVRTSIIDGSCHKHHFCHDKQFVMTNMCLS